MRFRCAMILAIIPALLLPPCARAEEGFWPFDMVPREKIAKRFEFQIGDEWLEKARRASLRVMALENGRPSGGGSASFVSPNGLVMTNRHVAAHALQHLSVPGKTDLIRDGFLARTQAEELRATNLNLEQLVEIINVNDKVRETAARQNVSEDEALQAVGRDARNSEARGMRIQPLKLYPEGEYRLYKYKIYSDVRVVFGADISSGYFGGDKDNFTYPRYDFDVAFLRAYENGKPAATPDYFPWSYKGAKAEELVFFAGNPGETDRSITLAHLEFERDKALPMELAMYARECASLHRFGELGAEQKQSVQDRLHSAENSLKRLRGQADGLKNAEVFARKKLEEENAAKLIGDPAKAKSFAEALYDMKRCLAHCADGEIEYGLLGRPWGVLSAQLRTAVLVASAEQRALAAQRGGINFRAVQQQELEQEKTYAYDPAHRAESERRFLEESFALALSLLGADHPLCKLLLDGKAPKERAVELMAHSRLGDPQFYEEASRSFPGIDKSGDALLLLGKMLLPRLGEVRNAHENDFAAVEKKCYASIAHALSLTNGSRRSPDGNFTPRLSFGTICGYEDGGKKVPPFTCCGCMFGMSERAANQEPYHLRQTWLDGRYKLNPCTPFNFVTDADGYGGNSGSPVFNRNREIVGLLFDGNYPGLVGKYIFDGQTKRSVCVDSRAIVEVMLKVYGAEDLVKEFAR
ncbi:MAG TPA: S46 family peptidase [Planctomycetota bacterium]|nr:S46 family peptidase [Planctomycetota bacterium]